MVLTQNVSIDSDSKMSFSKVKNYSKVSKSKKLRLQRKKNLYTYKENSKNMVDFMIPTVNYLRIFISIIGFQKIN